MNKKVGVDNFDFLLDGISPWKCQQCIVIAVKAREVGR